MPEYIGKHRPNPDLDVSSEFMTLAYRRDGTAIAYGQEHLDSFYTPRHSAEEKAA